MCAEAGACQSILRLECTHPAHPGDLRQPAADRGQTRPPALPEPGTPQALLALLQSGLVRPHMSSTGACHNLPSCPPPCAPAPRRAGRSVSLLRAEACPKTAGALRVHLAGWARTRPRAAPAPQQPARAAPQAAQAAAPARWRRRPRQPPACCATPPASPAARASSPPRRPPRPRPARPLACAATRAQLQGLAAAYSTELGLGKAYGSTSAHTVPRCAGHALALRAGRPGCARASGDPAPGRGLGCGCVVARGCGYGRAAGPASHCAGHGARGCGSDCGPCLSMLPGLQPASSEQARATIGVPVAQDALMTSVQYATTVSRHEHFVVTLRPPEQRPGLCQPDSQQHKVQMVVKLWQSPPSTRRTGR